MKKILFGTLLFLFGCVRYAEKPEHILEKNKLVFIKYDSLPAVIVDTTTTNTGFYYKVAREYEDYMVYDYIPDTLIYK